MSLSFSRSLSLFLSSGSLFLDKDHEGDSQYWGLTVGGQTTARFTQRKVQMKLGQRVQGVQEFRCCQGTAAAKREGWWLGPLRVAATASSEEDRGDERGGKYVTTTRGGVGVGGQLMAILAQGRPNLI